MNCIKNKGFTIIEMVVVIAVFLFIIGASMSIFISIFQHQKRVLAEQELLNQISYAEEYMSKALRMAAVDTTGSCTDNPGYIYLLTHPVMENGQRVFTGIRFLNQSGVASLGNPICQEFYLDNDVSGNTSTPLVLKEIRDQGGMAGRPVAFTSTNLLLDPENPVRFAINGTDGSAFGMKCADDHVDQCGISQCGSSDQSCVQPRVTILLNIKTSDNGQNYTRTIQTTVSRRNLNVK